MSIDIETWSGLKDFENSDSFVLLVFASDYIIERQIMID